MILLSVLFIPLVLLAVLAGCLMGFIKALIKKPYTYSMAMVYNFLEKEFLK